MTDPDIQPVALVTLKTDRSFKAKVEYIACDLAWVAWKIAGKWHTAPLQIAALKRVDGTYDPAAD